jgi:hypothetical protein
MVLQVLLVLKVPHLLFPVLLVLLVLRVLLVPKEKPVVVVVVV